MHRNLALIAMIAVIPGCEFLELGLNLLNQISETGSAKLIPFESEAELLSYFRDEIDNRNDRAADFFPLDEFAADGLAFDADDAAAAPPSAPGVDQVAVLEGGGEQTGFSTTTLQELGVDEADVVKTDGEFLYIISQGELSIVRIVTSTELVLESEFQLEGYGREMYLDGDKVIAISQNFGRVFFDDVFIPENGIDVDADVAFAPVMSRPTTIVTIIDKSDPVAPVRIAQTTYEGTLSASRKIDEMLYLVMANYQDYFYDVLPLLGQPQLATTEITLPDVLPDYEHIDADGNMTKGDVITWEDMYRPTDADGFGVLAIVSVNIENDGAFEAVGVVAEPGLIYASTEALYLTDTEYDFSGLSRETSDIYKFDFASGQAEPVATGSVPGRILNQYSMSEHNGFFRVATTVRPDGFAGLPHNDVYVLEQQADELVVVGSVQGIAPRETIQSARFVGDRAFVVTFESIDPFFTLDLSDPTNPLIVGELKVPGFSTFIVPMDDDHLLTVGQYIPENGEFFLPWGVQLSIFDVSNFAQPVLAHNFIIGEETGAYSEALFNPKAFTYFAQEGKIALPISIYEDRPFFFEDFVDGEVVAVDADDGEEEGVSSGGSGSTGDPADDPERSEDDNDDTDSDEPAEPPVSDEDPPVSIDEPFIRGGFDGLIVLDVSTTAGFTELTRISTRFEDAGFYGGSFTRGVFVGPDVFAVTDIGIRGETVAADDDVSFELFLGTPFPPFGIPTEPVGIDIR